MKKAIILLLALAFMKSAWAIDDVEPKYIKAGDLQPYYTAQIKDRSNAIINLSGCQAYFTMRDYYNSGIVAKVNRGACVITNSALGYLEYRWQPGDTNTPGVYSIEIYIEPAGGYGFTVPTNPPVKFIIIKNLFSTPTATPTITPTVTPTPTATPTVTETPTS
jgi:hypothetical protein